MPGGDRCLDRRPPRLDEAVDGFGTAVLGAACVDVGQKRLRLKAHDASVRLIKGATAAQGKTASHEAIYQFIYVMPRGELARNGAFLSRKQVKRRRTPAGQAAGQRRAPILGIVPSSSVTPTRQAGACRPLGRGSGDRQDLVIGKNGASAAITLVERTSRFVAILALPDGKESAGAADALIEHTAELPAMMRKSLTWDQGSEMARHAALTLATDLPVFFADPHSPWQRPSNENTNGLIPEYLPRGRSSERNSPT